MANDDERPATQELVALLRLVLRHAKDLGASGVEAAGHGADGAIGTFVLGRARRAVERPSADRDLGRALKEPAGGALARRAGRSGISRVARRVGPVARRSPAGLALRFGPAVYDVATGALREIDGVSQALVARALDNGRRPDPERIAAATVGVLGGQLDGSVVDAPDHLALARRWLRRIGGQMVPFGLLGDGIDVEALQAAIDRVPPEMLGDRRRRGLRP